MSKPTKRKLQRSLYDSSSCTSLLVLILDLSPLAWGERDLKRSAQDKARAASNKRSVGPATMEEMVTSTQAFASAFASMERDARFVLLGVADNETAILYPRKDALAVWLESSEANAAPNTHRMQEDILSGVATLTSRAAKKAAARVRTDASTGDDANKATTDSDPGARQGAIASAVSQALCLINRIYVATDAAGGVSALHSTRYLQRTDDDGVIALLGSSAGGQSKRKKTAVAAGAGLVWSSRIMIVQASDDRSRDYNALMNCAFAATQQRVVIDGCFLTAGGSGRPASSAFLEQICDLTGGVYLAPSGAAQVGGALTEVLMAVFLAPPTSRKTLHLPALNKVDFRARCFETAEIVDRAFVCNQCLSIFAQKPKSNVVDLENPLATTYSTCPTCQAHIVEPTQSKKT